VAACLKRRRATEIRGVSEPDVRDSGCLPVGLTSSGVGMPTGSLVTVDAV
jgi:hypothetical protein